MNIPDIWIGVIGVSIGAVISYIGNVINSKLSFYKSKRALKRERFEEVYQLTLDIAYKVINLPISVKSELNRDNIVFVNYDLNDPFTKEFEMMKCEINDSTNRLKMLLDLYLYEVKESGSEFIDTCQTIGAVKENAYKTKINEIFAKNLNNLEVGNRHLTFHDKEPVLNNAVQMAKETFINELSNSARKSISF